MAVPVLSLNLAPRPSLWRQHHLALGWIALGAGIVLLLGALGFTWQAYHQASRAGRDAVTLTEESRRASIKEQQIQIALQDMDASREQSRWKLAERILLERALPWSRLTAELEQCMVPDMRLKAIQRTRSSGQQVVMKIKGEAQTREAEAAFVEMLQGDPVFTQVVLEREAERTGGGWEFELSLPTAPVPPPFHLRINKLKAAAAPTLSQAIAPSKPPLRGTVSAVANAAATAPPAHAPVQVRPIRQAPPAIPAPPQGMMARPALSPFRPGMPKARGRQRPSSDPENGDMP